MDKNLDFLRNKIEEKELRSFSEYAAFSKDHLRKGEPEKDHRLPYRRDVDRIVHSKAYSRYVDKTQVVYLVDNDHISHRSIHVQLVSHFAKGIAEVLGLNTDLVEAISLGHDVGHPPFGHEGESYLSKISEEEGLKNFQHPVQSCRLFSVIEPLNLGLAVYDGFLCHDGAMQGKRITPKFNKTWADHESEIQQKIKFPEKGIDPATLEGALVKICDTISYTARDIEDAVALKIICREDIPETHLGKDHRTILTTFAQDIILSSENKDYITLSDESWQALRVLRDFNFKNIYFNPVLKTESLKIEKSYRFLFDYLLQDFNEANEQSYLFKNFLVSKSSLYLDSSSPKQKVIDYISGMTDNFFVRTIQNLLIPKRIVLN